jgi:transposase-like protein
VSLREEFVQLAIQTGVNRRELCRRFGISPKTGYKWLRRYSSAGSDGLQDGSRRPHRSPSRTPGATAQEVLRLRVESRNCWGGRKLSWPTTAVRDCRPAPLIIPRRGGLIDPARSAAATPWQRFERGGPNELWQWISRVTLP